MTVPENYETALARLEEIVKTLDKGELSLDAMLETYEEGMMLSRFCKAKLEEADGKIEILKQKADGTLERVPYDEKAAS